MSLPVNEEVWAALDRVVAAHEALKSLEFRRKELAGMRAAAIADARSHNASLDMIAERLGLSRERVRQIAFR